MYNFDKVHFRTNLDGIKVYAQIVVHNGEMLIREREVIYTDERKINDNDLMRAEYRFSDVDTMLARWTSDYEVDENSRVLNFQTDEKMAAIIPIMRTVITDNKTEQISPDNVKAIDSISVNNQFAYADFESSNSYSMTSYKMLDVDVARLVNNTIACAIIDGKVYYLFVTETRVVGNTILIYDYNRNSINISDVMFFSVPHCFQNGDIVKYVPKNYRVPIINCACEFSHLAAEYINTIGYRDPNTTYKVISTNEYYTDVIDVYNNSFRIPTRYLIKTRYTSMILHDCTSAKIGTILEDGKIIIGKYDKYFLLCDPNSTPTCSSYGLTTFTTQWVRMASRSWGVIGFDCDAINHKTTALKRGILLQRREYKVGDTVQIMDYDDMVNEYGTTSSGYIKTIISFPEWMKKFCGETAVITEIRGNVYKLNGTEDLDWQSCVFSYQHFVHTPNSVIANTLSQTPRLVHQLIESESRFYMFVYKNGCIRQYYYNDETRHFTYLNGDDWNEVFYTEALTYSLRDIDERVKDKTIRAIYASSTPINIMGNILDYDESDYETVYVYDPDQLTEEDYCVLTNKMPIVKEEE